MACLLFTITPVSLASLTVGTFTAATLSVTASAQPSLEVSGMAQATVAVEPDRQATLAVSPVRQLELSVGEACSVSGGELTVLATSDGPLRTRDGGFFLLDPEDNPPGE